MFQELATLAVHNLLRARARLVMTAGGVLVGTTAVVLLIALTIGLQNAAEAGFGNSSALTQIQVYPAWGESSAPELNEDAVRALSQIPGISAVIPMLDLTSWGQLVAGDYMGGGQILGINPRFLPYLGLSVSEGDLSIASGQPVVGPLIADNFYDPTAEEYQPIHVDLRNTPLELDVYSMDGTSTREMDLQISGILAPGTNYDYTMLLPISGCARPERVDQWAAPRPG